MDTKLGGKSALITGGTSGIGLAIARQLAQEGVNVAVVGRESKSEIANELGDFGVKAISLAADVSREENVHRMIEETIKEFGRIDLYVNNAARAIHQQLTKIGSTEMREIIDTNLSACIWACREVASHMIKLKSGSILIVGSTSMYTPGPKETIYRMTKTALKPLTESFATELAPFGIRVNLLIPGYYRTNLTAEISVEEEKALLNEIPLGRPGETVECASAAVFLLSDALSGYTTGAELLVDGGIAMRPLVLSNQTDPKLLNRD